MNDRHLPKKSLFPKSLFLTALFLLVTSFPASSQTIVVSEESPDWGFFEEIPSGSGELILGPMTAPLGRGSAQMTVDSTGRHIFGTLLFAGTRLDSITALAYSTYRVMPDGVLAISLQFDIDYDLTDMNEDWQGRLIYEPYYTETVLTGIWQTWNPLDGVWWSSGAPGNTLCPISSPCTWAEVLMNWPDAGVRNSVGVTQFKAGGPWDPFVGNVDQFTFNTMADDFTFDFEQLDIFSDGFESGNTSAWSAAFP